MNSDGKQESDSRLILPGDPEFCVKKEKAESSGSQNFDKIGAFYTAGGHVFMAGRNGERNHLFPLQSTFNAYVKGRQLALHLMSHGIDASTMLSALEDFKAKVKEAVKYRHKHNMPVPYLPPGWGE